MFTNIVNIVIIIRPLPHPFKKDQDAFREIALWELKRMRLASVVVIDLGSAENIRCRGRSSRPRRRPFSAAQGQVGGSRMPTLTGRLADLVRELDRLGKEPTLAALGQALQRVSLTPKDVAAYVQPTPGSYNRVPVVVR